MYLYRRWSTPDSNEMQGTKLHGPQQITPACTNDSSLPATQKPAPTPRPGGACAALLRPRCHRTHHHHLRQCLPRTTRPPACWPHHSFVQRCVPCTPRASGAHYAPLLAVAVRTAPASGRSAMQAPRRPRAEQPGHIDLRSCENPTTSPAAGGAAHAMAMHACTPARTRAHTAYASSLRTSIRAGFSRF
jgi:hypothetical protein